jgi:hypothetical protein
MKKFCAFGNHYKDKKGELIEESENYYIIKPDYCFQITAWIKTEVLLFDSKEDRDNWVEKQRYQYDER